MARDRCLNHFLELVSTVHQSRIVERYTKLGQICARTCLTARYAQVLVSEVQSEHEFRLEWIGHSHRAHGVQRGAGGRRAAAYQGYPCARKGAAAAAVGGLAQALRRRCIRPISCKKLSRQPPALRHLRLPVALHWTSGTRGGW